MTQAKNGHPTQPAKQTSLSANYLQRFSGLLRLFGEDGLHALANASVAVIGIGGVGVWAAEALARSGINNITLIDLDDIATSNINRQLHAMSSTIDQGKVEVMQTRINDINPDCQVEAIEDFVTPDNVSEYLTQAFDVVIDAIDSVSAKVAIIAHCKRQKIKLVTVGGAGGQINPLQITSGDLAKTKQDPLLAKVRSELRRKHRFSSNPQRRFSIEAIYSTEQLRYPTSDGQVSFEKSNSQGASKMDCSTGFGAFVGVTATFGFIAASRAIAHITK
ncbi:tRNA cyclic N6-threonylcarbamoyladenosine(37) synthase TcdA [Glaciecola siphonariae]|uniref:tRNA cyclic N6-threonylcarbamoyladenosine(37) synthase TcdA n=1 Tax=Glaciecola siphonariae TaxID=521012 RepID=A0ABV9LRI2_9ALTE